MHAKNNALLANCAACGETENTLTLNALCTNCNTVFVAAIKMVTERDWEGLTTIFHGAVCELMPVSCTSKPCCCIQFWQAMQQTNYSCSP